MNKIKVAIIGPGNIGSDLAERLLGDANFEVMALVGRDSGSKGLKRFSKRIPLLLSSGIGGLSDFIDMFEGIFDATSAQSAPENWEFARKNGKWLIDLTPSKLGRPFVPSIASEVPGIEISKEFSSNYSMITCGGQCSAPIVHAMAKCFTKIFEVEVSSSISSKSAGVATRLNLDQYIESTEELITSIANCSNSKAILVLNPCSPPIPMRTTITMAGADGNLDFIKENVEFAVSNMRQENPGFEMIGSVNQVCEKTYSVTLRVYGAGYFLPSYAGNLDIINSAAVLTAKMHSKLHRKQ